MAHIHPTQSGKFKANVNLVINGEKFRRSRTYDTYEAAVTWGKNKEDELRRLAGISDSVPIRTLLRDYECTVVDSKDRQARSRQEKDTAYKVRSKLKVIEKHLGDKLLDEVNHEIIERFRDKRLRKVSGSTVRKDLFFLSGFFKWLQRNGRPDLENPVKHVEKPPENPSRETIVTPEQELAFEKELKEPYLSIYQFLIRSTMRLGEVVDLRRSWMLTDKQVEVPPEFNKGKGIRDEARRVPLSKECREILERQVVSEDTDPDRYWDVKYGTVRRHFNRVRTRIGIPDVRLHDLKHTACTRLYDKHKDIKLLQDVTGNKCINTLSRVYVNTDKDALADRL